MRRKLRYNLLELLRWAWSTLAEPELLRSAWLALARLLKDGVCWPARKDWELRSKLLAKALAASGVLAPVQYSTTLTTIYVK